MKSSSETAYTKVVRYAVRSVQDGSWVFIDSALHSDLLRRKLPEFGFAADDMRKVLSLLKSEVDNPPVVIADPIHTYVALIGSGWYIDPFMRRWLAPEEAATDPPGAAPAFQTMTVTFGSVRTGWLPIAIAAAEQRFMFEASAVYDPFKELARWLERLLDGGTPRLMIHVEGEEVEFHTFERESDLIRLVVAMGNDRLSGDIKLDGVLPRRDLVRAFYMPLLAFWHDNVAPGLWLDGTAPPDPTKPPRDPDEMYDFYPVRSARIEAAFAQH